jgi:cytochrome P450
VFGADAALFRPERWLVDNPGQISRMDRYYIPFGVGSRTCIGRNISMLEISKLVPELIRNFDFTLALRPGEKLELENMWFVKQKNFFCRVKERGE